MDDRFRDWSIKALFATIFVVASSFILQKTGISFPVNVTTSQVSSELSVVGEGKIDVTPDTAYVDIGVTVEKIPTAEEAQNKLSQQNNTIVAAVKGLGISDENIKTSNFSISPNYVYDSGRNRTEGFTGNSTVTVKTEKIDLAGKIIEAATKAGATNVGGTRFVVDKPEVYREQARDAAIKNAKDQAQKLASTLGIRLGKITNVVESSPGVISPMFYSEKAVAVGMGGGAPDLQPGNQTITSTVTLYFEKQ